MMCFLWFHDWRWPWKVIYDEQGAITGYYYKECANPGCRKVKIKWNYDKFPEEK